MYSFFKRTADIIVSFFSLLLLSPLFLLLAIVIKIDSKGPVIFKQKRLGKNGKVFNMYKFRSMVVGAEHMGTGLMNYEGDNRVTKVGKFLRTTSLDELPQLWSILTGKMSFVGPRPALFNQDDLVALRTQFGIEKLRPGLTGWAQINGRDELAIPDKVKLEVEYKERQSFLFDLKIMWLTAWRVLFEKGVSH